MRASASSAASRMIPAALRQDFRWFERARTESLPTMAVGGIEIPPPVARPELRPTVTCHDCPEQFGDPDACLQHMYTEHGRDRRRVQRRAA